MTRCSAPRKHHFNFAPLYVRLKSTVFFETVLVFLVNLENFTRDFVSKVWVFGLGVRESSNSTAFWGLLGLRSDGNFEKLSRVEYRSRITLRPLVTVHTLSVPEAEAFEQLEPATPTLSVDDVVSSEVLKSGRFTPYRYGLEALEGDSPPSVLTFEPTEPVRLNN